MDVEMKTRDVCDVVGIFVILVGMFLAALLTASSCVDRLSRHEDMATQKPISQEIQ